MALYTYRPKKGIGKDLPEAELEEFNCITYEKIINMTDMKKLLRLEQYMREEEFTQTSQLARKRIVELGGNDMCPYGLDPQFCDLDAEYDEFLKNFDTWQESIKQADNNLIDLDECKQKQQPLLTMELVSKQQHNRSLMTDNLTNEEILKAKLRKKIDLRDQRSYYEEWNKYATSVVKEIEAEEKKIQENAKVNRSCLNENTNSKEDFRGTTMLERLLSIGKSRSMTERKWLSEREREKGNDLFKAREYSASIDAYTMAIEFFPESTLAYGNRAASHIKVKRWEEVVKDCCTAIQLDGKYMKGYMRRGLANFQLGNLQEAIKDLQTALKLDPQNQETLAIIQRTKCELKKHSKNEAIEIKHQIERKEGIELQITNEEVDIFKNMTNSSNLSNTSIRMIIDEENDGYKFEKVKDTNIKDIKTLTNKNMKTTVSSNAFEKIKFKKKSSNKIEAKKPKNKFMSSSQQKKPNFQDCKFSIEKSIVRKKNVSETKLDEELMSNHEENNLEPKNIICWPNRPYKQAIQTNNALMIDDTISNSTENEKKLNNIFCNVENQQEFPKIEKHTFSNIFDHQSKELNNNNNQNIGMDSKVCDVDLTQEIIEAGRMQKLIPTDHIAF